MEGKLSERAVYKMVKNYLANELGVNRTYIDSVVAAHVRDRNIEAMVHQETDAYIHNHIPWHEKNPDGVYVANVVERRIMNLVDQYVKERIERGVRERIQKIVDAEVERILANVDVE